MESLGESTIEKIKIKKLDHRVSEHLERFKYATLGRRGTTPPEIKDENDWWALGQHYGLATPLLDWTKSPFVAAYFAFISQENPQTEYRAVYALHKGAVDNRSQSIRRLEREKKTARLGSTTGVELGYTPQPSIEFVRPFSDENQRLVNQGGLFTRSPDDIDLTSWVKNNFKDQEDYILMKLLIPNNEREYCLKSLNRMNINHLTLFPDLDGASHYCNLYAQIDKY